MEWYYLVLIVIGIIGISFTGIWTRLNCLEKKLFNHLGDYREFVGRVDTTIQFFRRHFKELDEALKEKENKE